MISYLHSCSWHYYTPYSNVEVRLSVRSFAHILLSYFCFRIWYWTARLNFVNFLMIHLHPFMYFVIWMKCRVKCEHTDFVIAASFSRHLYLLLITNHNLMKFLVFLTEVRTLDEPVLYQQLLINHRLITIHWNYLKISTLNYFVHLLFSYICSSH